ncbi:glycosyltransferase family 4 protein [Streptomyces sp. NPDC046887]|uniref:glycosyltransferase family 4 protein n=1 Tax=Streptomyces sp. NPDC046887 TaxID=3155472 RepID=UPI0033C0D008
MSAENPYRHAGLPVRGEDFTDRPALVEQVRDVWRKPGRPANLSVLGQLRYGKTSLVDHALLGMDRSDLAVVRLDIGAQESVFGLFRSFTREVRDRFPEVGELGPLDRVVQEARGWYDVESAVKAFFQAAKQHRVHVLLVLDDFDRAPWVLVDLSGYLLLRALVSEPYYPVGLVTVSRRSVFAIEADAMGGSRLDGVITQRCEVGLLTPSETAALLDRGRAAGADLRALESEILAWSGRHPHLLALLCRRLLQGVLQTSQLDLAAALEQEESAFRSYFGRLTEEVDLALSGRGTDLLRKIADGAPVSSLPREDLRDLRAAGVAVRDGTAVRLFSPVYADYLRTPADEAPATGAPSTAAAPIPPAAVLERCTALVVATEWGSAHGGLSTFSRQLCLALARQQVRVVCLVLDATEAEVAGAEAQGVTLRRCEPLAGEANLARRLDLPRDLAPDLVIGHGRVTGRAALIQAEHFPGARKLHFVHMAPDEIEWHKADGGDDQAESADNRTRMEVALGRTADHLVAVGPVLHGRFLGHFARRDDTPPLRFDPGFDLTDVRPRRVPDGTPLTVLLMGRTEDAHLKGLDLAAAACGLVAGWRDDAKLRRIELVVRGVPSGAARRQLAELNTWAAEPRLSVVPRPYTVDPEHLDDDLQRAGLLIMPSRAEGFGLVGVEAVMDGTPILVSERSGLGVLLREVLGDERAASWVVPMSGDTDRDIQTWARAIDGMLREREDRFAAAEALRVELARRRPWSAAVDGLLTALGL